MRWPLAVEFEYALGRQVLRPQAGQEGFQFVLRWLPGVGPQGPIDEPVHLGGLLRMGEAHGAGRHIPAQETARFGSAAVDLMAGSRPLGVEGGKGAPAGALASQRLGDPGLVAFDRQEVIGAAFLLEGLCGLLPGVQRIAARTGKRATLTDSEVRNAIEHGRE